MKTRLLFPLLSSAALMIAATSRGEAIAKTADDRPKLAIVVVETLPNGGGTISAFDRLDLAFQQIALKRKWPVVVEAERFASNIPSHEIELRIFNQPLRQELPGELMFRSWMILSIQGVKHDFGIVSFRYNPRPFENMDDILDKIFRGAADAAADKIQPILFRKRDVPNP